jgi:carbon storage regulator
MAFIAPGNTIRALSTCVKGTYRMLVLRRKAGEAIVLNGVIRVVIFSIEGERVKIGIDAPPDVIIVRDELLDNPPAGNSLPQPTPPPRMLPPRSQDWRDDDHDA